MVSTVYSRAVLAAAALVVPTVSAAFNAGSSGNVAVYWGQGYDQKSLSEICDDDTVDIINLSFVNQFPKKKGEYPATNFGMSCTLSIMKDLTDSGGS